MAWAGWEECSGMILLNFWCLFIFIYFFNHIFLFVGFKLFFLFNFSLVPDLVTYLFNTWVWEDVWV